MFYQGSCHCGAVTFEVAARAPDKAVSCNCSHCRRKGFLWAFVPAPALTVTQGEEVLVEYRFNQHKLAHLFCPTCGCQGFAKGKGPDGSDMAAINLRCIAEVDVATIKIEHVDGASF